MNLSDYDLVKYFSLLRKNTYDEFNAYKNSIEALKKKYNGFSTKMNWFTGGAMIKIMPRQSGKTTICLNLAQRENGVIFVHNNYIKTDLQKTYQNVHSNTLDFAGKDLQNTFLFIDEYLYCNNYDLKVLLDLNWKGVMLISSDKVPYVSIR